MLRRRGVVHAGVFGSFALGKERKGSDIDILIEFSGRKSLLDLIALEQELKERLGRSVDLLTYNSIYPPLRSRILGEEVRIL